MIASLGSVLHVDLRAVVPTLLYRVAAIQCVGGATHLSNREAAKVEQAALHRIEIDRPGASATPATAAATEMNWMHDDRFGSPVALSNQVGVLRERLAYDAWGKRRTLNGAPINAGGNLTATPNSLDGVTDNRGFTGHEMLDLLDLVHMNGRIYDPLLGKFLSADPLIQDPLNGQSYNRYSYVLNNPTNLTDPTGFASMDDTCTGSRIPGGCGGYTVVAGEGGGALPDFAANKAKAQAEKSVTVRQRNLATVRVIRRWMRRGRAQPGHLRAESHL